MITAALIGLGNIAWKYDANNPDSSFALSQAGAMQKHAGVQLVGGCAPDSSDKEGFSTWTGGLPTFSTPEEMLHELKPEMVGICSPTEKHFEHALLCLESGVALLWLEKPPAQSLQQVQLLAQLAAKRQAKVCVNFFRRYLPCYKKLQEMVLHKELGRTHLIRILYSPGLSRNGVHLLDQIFFITGATSYKILWVDGSLDPENPAFSLFLSTGEAVHCCGANLPYHTNNIEVVCENGVVSIKNGGKEALVERCSPNASFPGFYELTPEQHRLVCLAGIDNYLQEALDDLVQSAQYGVDPKSNLTSAGLAQQLLEEILWRARA